MRARLLIGLVAVLALGTGCAPRPSTGGGDPCVVGEYSLTAQHLLRPLSTPLGTVTISGGIGGRHLSIRADGSASVSAAGTDPLIVGAANVAGTVLATASASGTWTTSPGNAVDLTLAGLTGTVTFDGTIDGTVRHVVVDLVVSGLAGAVAPSGRATYSCGDSLVLHTATANWTWTRV